MKKRKLISLVSACSVLTTTVPFFATSCKKNKEDVVAMSTVTSTIPEVIMVNKYPEDQENVIFTSKFLNSAQVSVSSSTRWDYSVAFVDGDEAQKSTVTIGFTEGENKLNMSVGFTNKTEQIDLNSVLVYKVTVKAYPTIATIAESSVGTKELFIHVVPYNKNFIFIDGKQEELKENVDINDFCWSQKTTPSGKVVPNAITVQYKDKELDNIEYKDRAKITGLSIQTCSVENSVIAQWFLSDCEYLNFVNIYGLLHTPITEIGDNFLSGCCNLLSVDLSPLDNVLKVGKNFLRACSKLELIEMMLFNDVHNFSLTDIGNNFLLDCGSIKALDFRYFKDIKTIGESFLRGCKNLVSLNLVGFEGVTIIPDSFLADCWSLSMLSGLDSFKNVEDIGSWFLGACTSLTEVDLSEFEKLTIIENYFLSDCTNIITLIMPRTLFYIGDYFLNDCVRLEYIDLSKVCEAHGFLRIGTNFLNNCVYLNNLRLPIIPNPGEELQKDMVYLSGWGMNVAYFLDPDEQYIHCGNEEMLLKYKYQWENWLKKQNNMTI